MDVVFWVLIVAYTVFHLVVMVTVFLAARAAMSYFDAENLRRAAEERADLQRRFGAR